MIKRLVRRCLPSRFQRKAVPRFASLSFSQEGEDRVIERIIGDTKSNGFFVNVGAYHPLQYSNTYRFYMKGWHGINIDARPGSMAEFIRVRPRDINLELAIAEQEEWLTYHEFNPPALNGFSEEMARKAAENPQYKLLGTRRIRAVPLASVLTKYVPKDQPIDFLDVDAEGLDEAVLRSNDWETFRPRLVLAEDVGQFSVETALQGPVARFLYEKGYVLVAKTLNTLIFQCSE